LTRAEDGDHVTLHESIYTLVNFRSIDPLFGAFLCEMLARGDFTEKVLALEGALEIPAVIERFVRIPDLPPGPLRTQVLEPLLISIGAVSAVGAAGERDDGDEDDDFEDEEEEHAPTLAEMLKTAFDARLKAPEDIKVQPKWVAGAAIEFDCDFYKLVKAANLVKQEGIILRHLLRLVILAGEFFARTADPDYQRLSELATETCRRVDPKYTDRFLAEAAAAPPA
jgi:hypothetical protein